LFRIGKSILGRRHKSNYQKEKEHQESKSEELISGEQHQNTRKILGPPKYK
jgi:hypothetical protein